MSVRFYASVFAMSTAELIVEFRKRWSEIEARLLESKPAEDPTSLAHAIWMLNSLKASWNLRLEFDREFEILWLGEQDTPADPY